MTESKRGRQAAALLKARDLRITPQRYAVLDYVVRHPMHLTAEEIFHGINRSDPRASRATVYNSLHTLVAAGLVREVRVDGKSARFDANMGAHHHFVCESCGAVEDIARPITDGVPDQALLGARQVRSYEVLYRGRCAACAPKEEERNG